MKIDCEVIHDLLPLYVDNLTSKESNKLVNTHLMECENCNQLHSEMAQDLNISSQIEAELPEEMERQLIKRIKKKRILNFGSLIIIFSLVGFVIGAYALYSNYAVIKAVEPIELFDTNRNVQENPAKEILLKSSSWKQYKVDNKTFSPGYYDITALEGTVEIGSVHLKKGDQYLGAQFYSNNLISVKGSGIAKLTPAKFITELLENGVYTISNKSVVYKVGDEIQPGSYKINVISNNDANFYVFASVSNSNLSQVRNSLDIKNSKEYTLTVKEGEVLQLLNWSSGNTDFTITLSKI
ncbi:zf-HC2 domain-containing protein [Rummeliibacillus pycnus]|uniref:zf-HC2 domain-containing protein n=1 Tax=Rummeliibacillus pycnus TaxID=101070 RepID=UPI003D290E15